MPHRRLLLLSNSKNFGSGYLTHAEGTITDFLGAGVADILFVPFAAVRASFDDFTAMVGERFAAMGYGLQSLHAVADPQAAIQAARAIAVGGGNTFALLKRLYDLSLLEPIRAAVLAGTPYMGWSAGANVAGPTIRTTNDMPIVESPSLTALGLVPFQINPHYTDGVIPQHSGETRADRLLEFVEANPGVPVVGLREGTLLRVEGGRLTLIGEKAARVFLQGREPYEVEPGGGLQPLMASTR
jgi:dipeptidase E